MEAAHAEKRRLDLDCVRILAMLLVIFNHTGTFGFFRFAQTQNPLLYWIYLVCSVVCIMGVPLFFMVSGALLLGRVESIGTLLRKRALRIALVILLFSLLQFVFQVRFQGKPADVPAFLFALYTDQIVPPFWFLYAYLALMLMLPFLRRMAAGMNRTEFRYLALLYVLLTGVLPVVQYALFRREFAVNLNLPLVTTASIFYCLTGYALDRLAPEERGKSRMRALAALSVLGIAVCAVMTHWKGRLTGVLTEETSQTFLACFCLFPAATVFLFLKNAFERAVPPPWAAALIRSLGGCAFGVYLFHAMLMDRLMPLLYFLQERIDTFPACIVYVLAVFLAGYVLTWLLKKIPFVNRLL